MHTESEQPDQPAGAEPEEVRAKMDSEMLGLEIPADAGPYREDLIAILSRIPPHWGRWIDCGAGWFHLIVEVHEHLLELDPNYVVLQIKEKYGGLRYYAGSPHNDPAVQERFSALLDVAERFSRSVCELCGERARLLVSNDIDPVYKTLCDACAASQAAAGGRVYRPHVTPPRQNEESSRR